MDKMDNPVKKGVKINTNSELYYASSVGVGEDNDEIRLIFFFI